MADAANKYPENVPGKFYVDNQCIDCDLCRETAPDNFKRNEDGGYTFGERTLDDNSQERWLRDRESLKTTIETLTVRVAPISTAFFSAASCRSVATTSSAPA